MIDPFLMGLVAGARSLTPLAAVAWLARAGKLPNEGSVGKILASGWVVAGTTALAISEMLGDKMRTAPDRTVLPGLIARVATSALAGAALARRRDQAAAAVLAGVAAVGSSYLTLAARRRLMERYGQKATGTAEDVFVLLAALWIASLAMSERQHKLRKIDVT